MLELSEQDLEQIQRHGVSLDEVERQLHCFTHTPRGIHLARPARIGDGIVELAAEDLPRLDALYDEAAGQGRFAKFVPASGAATRMFRALLAVLHGEAQEKDLDACRRFVARLDDFPFAPELRQACAKAGVDLAAIEMGRDPKPLLEALLGDQGFERGESLNLAHTAKALIPFHRDREAGASGVGRSALEEHLIEAALHLRDARGHCRVHFTIPQHQELIFREELRAIEGRLEKRFGGVFDLSWSVQSPVTDTIAAGLEGQPFRLDDGSLVLRPGGHGALLLNLEKMGGDLVFVRNIDNVLPESRRGEALTWNRLLGGYLLELEALAVDILGRLASEDGDGWLAEALEQVAARLEKPEARRLLDSPAAEQRAWLAGQLDRPIRVCGVVVNSGEPGGGPFWVREQDGRESLQIVETSQVDRQDPEQEAILRQATHFNPVHLICRLRSREGEPYKLQEFVDPETVFISRKSLQGRPLLALEHPGLWNGAMARWNTVFVAIPAAIFAPVKTVFDLLRPEHQP
jgi:hypothetical protein